MVSVTIVVLNKHIVNLYSCSNIFVSVVASILAYYHNLLFPSVWVKLILLLFSVFFFFF